MTKQKKYTFLHDLYTDLVCRTTAEFEKNQSINGPGLMRTFKAGDTDVDRGQVWVGGTTAEEQKLTEENVTRIENVQN